MYRELRNKNKKMSDEKLKQLLEEGEYGILSTVDKENQPYATPLSYIAIDNNIYFHGAKEGHKVDNINNETKVCFCIVGKTEPVYDNIHFSSYYESIVAFGKASKLEDIEEKEEVLFKMTKKYFPNNEEEINQYVKKFSQFANVYKITIEHITGKESKKE